MSEAQNQLEREQRRKEVARLYLHGNSQRAIAEILGVGVATVNRDISYIQDEWKKTQLETMDNAIAKQLTELDFMRKQFLSKYTTKDLSPLDAVHILDRLFKVQEREAKLLGLDAPQRQHVTTTPTTIEIVFGGDDDQSTDTYS